MAYLSTIRTLPPTVRQWLNDRLFLNGFRDYSSISDELKGMGYSISRSALHRWGQALRAQTDQAEIVRLTSLGNRKATP